MRLFLLALFGMLLLFGCISTGGETQLPEYNGSTVILEPTCMEHCTAQPHVACVGEWNISG
ncbi:hypothetical protein H0O00_05480, partial [Candidatus Micrarchaeota archaeon]|nr:hypothetical protein [Candidatus Micrarchaeota archaeon]